MTCYAKPIVQLASAFAIGALASSTAAAQDVRRFTRPPAGAATTISDSQASDVTLTLTDVAQRPIQTWVRAAGIPDASRRKLTVKVSSTQAALLESGQRARAFSVNSRTQMQQGRVARIARTSSGAEVDVDMASPLVGTNVRYLVEVVTEKGPFLSVPNVSIIEDDARKVVYLQQGGAFARREIKTGVQGELYTQVVEGLDAGDQIVSVGSFFVDAETKLRSTGAMGSMPGMDHGSMAGMDHGAMPGMDHGAMAMSGALQNVQDPGGKDAASPDLKAVYTEPAASAALASPVMMIHVMFNHPVEPTKSRMSITSANGAQVSAGAPMPMGKDGKTLMLMADAPLQAGAYTVKWQAEGRDAKVASGSFSFIVK